MKTYDKPRQYMKKQTLPAKVHIVKAPIVMYEYESQTIKKAEH